MRMSTGVWFAATVVLGGAMAHAQATPKMVTVQMETSAGQDGGKATLIGGKTGVKVNVDFKNLTPGEHAIHFHQNPKCDAPEFKTAGGHFNPAGKQHGIQNPQGHHAGDMPINLTVGDDGTVKKSFFTKDLTLDPQAANSVFANGGTSIMVHAAADDMKSDPAGNAGARESCGIVSIQNASDKLSAGAHAKGGTEPASNQ